MKQSRLKYIIRLTVALIMTGILSLSALGCAGLGFGGCSIFSDTVSFNRDEINIRAGETIDVSGFIDGDESYYLESSNRSVFQVVTSNSIKAVGKGSATLSALTYSAQSGKMEVAATAKVVSEYDDVTSIDIYSADPLQIDAGKNITLNAVINEGIDPKTKLSWMLNGESASGGTDLSLSGLKTGRHVVTATAGELTKIAELFVYDNILATACAPQNLIYENGQIASFSMSVNSDSQNPAPFVEWLVDGVTATGGYTNDFAFDFAPSRAGEYKISALLNGKEVLFEDGSTYKTVIFKGEVEVRGLKLDFDSFYPKVMLLWDNREETLFDIEIRGLINDDVQNISGVSASAGGLDIARYITLTQGYSVKVTNAGNGSIYYPSTDGKTVTHTAINAAAARYLAAEITGGNCYMTNDDEIVEVFDYMIAFRPNAKEKSDKINGKYYECKMSIYMGYTSYLSSRDLSALFSDALTQTGRYGWSISGGTVMEIMINFYSMAAPDNFNLNNKKKYENISIPYSSAAGRTTLPVDSFDLSGIECESSEQLYYTLQKQLRPQLKEGSQAQTIYNAAYNVLCSITDWSMTEEQIALAIYDYLLFAVSYDYEVLSIGGGIDKAVLQPAYYLEGVFLTGYAVCDGIAKAYSLLCNMAGIDCLRVIGTAMGGSSYVEHAWNKIKLDGQYYTVDATWGIKDFSYSGRSYKLSARRYFLMTDGEAGSRVEIGGRYPSTATTPYFWYEKNGLFIHDTQDIDAQTAVIINNLLKNRAYIFGYIGGEYALNYYALHFKVASTLATRFSVVSKNPAATPLKNQGINTFVPKPDQVYITLLV